MLALHVLVPIGYLILVTKTQLEGTSPQVDNRGVRPSAEILEAVRVRAKRSERPGFESPCGAFAREASDASSRSERARGRGGKGRSRSERCVRGLKKKIVTSPRSLDPILIPVII